MNGKQTASFDFVGNISFCCLYSDFLSSKHWSAWALCYQNKMSRREFPSIWMVSILWFFLILQGWRSHWFVREKTARDRTESLTQHTSLICCTILTAQSNCLHAQLLCDYDQSTKWEQPSRAGDSVWKLCFHTLSLLIFRLTTSQQYKSFNLMSGNKSC